MSLVLVSSLLYSVHCIEVLQNFSDIYYLFSEEYTSIYLDNYFIGDYLNYSISPANPSVIHLQNLQTFSVPLNKSKPVLESPKKNTVIQSTCIYYQESCNIAFYESGSNLIIFSYNNTAGIESILFNINFNKTISFTSMALINQGFSILVITKDNSNLNSFYNNTFYFTQDVLSHSKTYELNATEHLQTMHITDISQNSQTGVVSIAGIAWEYGYLIVLNENFTEKYQLVFYRDVVLYNILLVNNEDDLFVLLVELNTLHHVVEHEESYIYINNSVYVPTINLFAFSMEYIKNLDSFYIVIGCVSKFIIISSDFQRIVQKKLTMHHSEVYPAVSLGNYLFLFVHSISKSEVFVVGSNTNAPGDNLNLMFTYELNRLTSNNTAWLGIDYFDETFMIIYSNSSCLNASSINYMPAQLNFTSLTQDQVKYVLTVEDSSKNYLTVNFSVVMIIDDTLYSLDYNSPIVFSFDDLDASVEINIYDYICGSNIKGAFLDIDDKGFYEIFNIRTNFNEFIKKNDSIDIKIELEQPNYMEFTNITLAKSGFFIYNSNYIQYYNEFNLIEFSKKFENMTIVSILYTDFQTIIVHCSNKNVSGIISLNSIYDITDNCPEIYPTKLQCIEVRSANEFVSCMGKNIIYNFVDNNNNLSISSYCELLLNSDTFVDIFLMNNFYLLSITAEGYFLMYNLQENQVFDKLINPFFKKLVGAGASKVMSYDGSFYYIFFDDYNLKVYDSDINYLKTSNINSTQRLVLNNEIVYAMVKDSINIFNFTGFLINSNIINTNSNRLISFDANFNKLAELYAGSVLLYEINENYNTLNAKIQILPSSELSKSTYSYNSSLTVVQENANFTITATLELMINGQTVYYNSETAKSIQKNQMKISCGDSLTIPLDDIFLGQNLNVTLNQTTKYVQINNRLDLFYRNYTNKVFVDFIYIQEVDIYIAIEYPNTVLVFDNLFNVRFSYSINKTNYECNAYSINFLFSDSDLFIIVGVGCIYNNWDSQRPALFDLDYIQFFSLTFFELTHLLSFPVSMVPNRLKLASYFNGRFIIVFTENHPSAKPNSFYSNFVGICSGMTVDFEILVLGETIISSESLNLPSMYIIDFDLLLYPLLAIEVLYLLNIEGTLIIISYELLEQKHVYLSTVEVGYFPVSLTRCGQNLFIAYSSNEVDQYFLQSWQLPVYSGSIQQFGNNFITIPGSLKCSDTSFAKYLLMVMIKDNSTYLQVMDNTANELASIITQKLLSNKTENTFGVFTSPNDLTVVSESFYYKYMVQDYVMTIIPPNSCKKKSEIEFTLDAKNSLNYSKNASFTLKIESNYNQGSVTVKSLSIADILGISGASLVAIVLIYYIFRICNKKRKKNIQPQNDLFNYEFEILF